MRCSVCRWVVAITLGLGVGITHAQSVHTSGTELIVSFELSKYLLSPAERHRIQTFYSMNIAPIGANVSIVGHADQSGDEKLNIELSRKRAQQVAKELIRLGLNPAQLNVDWKGEFDPTAPNDAQSPDKRNRIAVVRVTS